MPELRKRRLSAGWTLILVGLILFLRSSLPAQIPERFTNLKVLPKDIGQKELVDEMKQMTFALNTRCWFCHEGQGDDLSTYDFASDAKKEKIIARVHLQMTNELNEKFFKGAQNAAPVTCFTCHRGEKKTMK